MELRFEKYEGLGNDFLIVEDAPIDGELAKRLCDRHRGVGGDGVLLVGERDRRAFMRVFNADGSTSEMCGNGLRCVALYLHQRGRSPREIDTDAGLHRVEVDRDRIEVSMRPPSLAPHDVPIVSTEPWIDAPFAIEGHSLHVTAVSIGNPHAVFFDRLDDRDRVVLAPAIQNDPRFPHRANVGFARLEGDAIALAVFERGVGWTQACGTGACAAAVAAVETGRARRGQPIEVRLPGGTLTITVGEPGTPVRMAGPARRVFAGAITI